ncbi:hypothetical protein ETAA8_62930 [Anatilimnocola aggregata]|uniref:Polymerase nucleotidyl transferase domain-containing protein n=1 Tax=Anatilimnocola aggregata TaxID=2528021 RepID=A0A517YLQ2_9BACT|nr:hypothetical protein [Anatilimnocola aggregata]QDU31140.1 hypothetical protein ETAA8_62930 [Anatilimnocola aggregata]
MTIPDFDAHGELPAGIWLATIAEVLERFGKFGDLERKEASQTLAKIHELAVNTGHLQSMLVFGSYVTSKPNPNDVDVILMMDDAVDPANCPVESRVLFDRQAANAQLGASVFWIRPALNDYGYN